MKFREFLAEAKQDITAKVGLEFQMLLPMTGQEILASLEQHIDDDDIKLHSADDSKKRNPRNWHIQHDQTIGDHGVEITSPPQPLNDAFKDLDLVCAWMEQNNAETGSNTALRVQIGIQQISEKLDPVKLAIFMGDEHAQRAFADSVGTFSKPQLEVISERLKKTGKLPSSVTDDLERVAMKYLALKGGPNRLGSGFLELRVQGGKNYEKVPRVLRAKIFKLVKAVETACDPTAEKSEYRSKLLEILGSEATEQVTKNDMKDLPAALHRLYNHNPDINEAWKVFAKDQTVGDARSALLTLINTALKTAKHQKTSLNIHEKTLLRRLAKEAALQESDVEEYFKGDHMARQNFKKDIGL